MNCPNCGHHVPQQRRLWRTRRASPATRLYKRVFMRAKRLGVTLRDYERLNVRAYHAGLEYDRDVLELPRRTR